MDFSSLKLGYVFVNDGDMCLLFSLTLLFNFFQHICILSILELDFGIP